MSGLRGPLCTPIPLAAQRTVPWRNGGGVTREVAIDPPDADVSTSFRWRISRAQVAQDGPFSRFAGCDRSLWLLDGRGIELDVDGARHRLALPGARLDFAGECAVHGRLLDGPIEDCNVIADRTQVEVTAAIVETTHANPLRHSVATAATTIVVALTGELVAMEHRLERGDALRIEALVPFELPLRARAGTAAALVATFAPRDGSSVSS